MFAEKNALESRQKAAKTNKEMEVKLSRIRPVRERSKAKLEQVELDRFHGRTALHAPAPLPQAARKGGDEA
jgi:hypothetical protein